MGSVASGLQAALLFARGREDGLRYIEPDRSGVARSFWALPLAMPAIVCLTLINWVQGGVPAQAGHALGLDLMAFVLGWIGYAVVTYELVRYVGGADRWPCFIATWNWCNVVENLLLVFGSIPALLGAPAIVAEAAELFAIGWALWIEWFAIRSSLRANWMVAAWLVVLDQAIGLTLATVSYRLMHL